jgi:vancomycin resistance protein YoaR
LRRNLLDYIALTLVVTLLLGAATVSLYQLWHANRIFSGVTVAGVPVGGLTRGVAQARLKMELSAYPVPPVNLTFDAASYPIDPMGVRAEADLLDAVNQAYLAGRSGDWLQRLGEQASALMGALTVTPSRIYSTDLLEGAIAEVAAQVNRDGRPAAQLGIISTSAESALLVDEAMTLAALTDALDHAPAGQPLNVAMVVNETAPSAAGSSMAPVALEPLFDKPMLLRSAGGDVELALDPAALASIVISDNPVQADPAALRAYLEDMAAQIELPARDARLRFNPATGGVSVLQESLTGRSLDVEATLASVQQALATGEGQAELAVSTIAPAVDSNRIAEMGIRELVASSSTYFKGSSADRVRNVEVAAEKFDGVVIPPGGIFSFNRIVEDVSAANGFEDSLVIWGDRTAVGVGGGVCQVSTTVFRTAYEGGFPIVERYNHGYVVDWYGEPGMDATIYTPSVDFKFRNDTDAYLLIEPVIDSVNGVATFNFYGTRPNRQVSVSKPVVSNVKAPEPPVYSVDPSLNAGQVKQVDWQKQGMTVEVTRTIVEDGTTRTDTLKSVYQPWQSVYLVGSEADIPAGAASDGSN